MLPTLEDALEHLKLDAGYDDVKVQLCLDAARQVALDFLDLCPEDSNSSSSDAINSLPESVNHAILMITESLYDRRVAGESQILQPGSTEWMLLYPHRRVGV